MAEIIDFPFKGPTDEQMDEMMHLFVNYAICDSTNETLIDSDDIEERLAALYKEDNIENRVSLISGLCFFGDIKIVGDEDTWGDYMVTDNKTTMYAVYTDEDKLPAKYRRNRDYSICPFRFLVEGISEEDGNTEICINPGSKENYIVKLALIRVALEIIDKAIDFAEGLMKQGLNAESLTDIMFERFQYRKAEVILKDGTKLVGQVEDTTFGYEENANFTFSINGKELQVFRKDIKFIKAL